MGACLQRMTAVFASQRRLFLWLLELLVGLESASLKLQNKHHGAALAPHGLTSAVACLDISRKDEEEGAVVSIHSSSAWWCNQRAVFAGVRRGSDADDAARAKQWMFEAKCHECVWRPVVGLWPL